MHLTNVVLLFATAASTVSATVCWTNGASLLLGRPLSNPLFLPKQQNCGLPLQNGGTGNPAPPPVCPPPSTITQYITVVSTSVSVSTTTSTTTSTSTTTETSTTTSTTTTTDTSYGIHPATVASALSRCLGRNPAYTKPLFDSNGRPACCVPITTIGANSLPTGIC